MTLTNKEDALGALRCVRIDIEMLKNGEWVPDEDSCDATIDVLSAVIEFMELQNENS